MSPTCMHVCTCIFLSLKLLKLGNILCDIKVHVKGKKAGITKLNAALVIITYSGVFSVIIIFLFLDRSMTHIIHYRAFAIK